MASELPVHPWWRGAGHVCRGRSGDPVRPVGGQVIGGGHRQGDVGIPGSVVADLVVVEPGLGSWRPGSTPRSPNGHRRATVVSVPPAVPAGAGAALATPAHREDRARPAAGRVARRPLPRPHRARGRRRRLRGRTPPQTYAWLLPRTKEAVHPVVAAAQHRPACHAGRLAAFHRREFSSNRRWAPSAGQRQPHRVTSRPGWTQRTDREVQHDLRRVVHRQPGPPPGQRA
jgi:hypothetical protein